MGEAGGSWASGRVPDVPPCHQVGEVLPREGASAPSPHRNGANRPHSDKRDGFSRCQFQQAFLPPSLCYFLLFFFSFSFFFFDYFGPGSPTPSLAVPQPCFSVLPPPHHRQSLSPIPGWQWGHRGTPRSCRSHPDPIAGAESSLKEMRDIPTCKASVGPSDTLLRSLPFLPKPSFSAAPVHQPGATLGTSPNPPGTTPRPLPGGSEGMGRRWMTPPGALLRAAVYTAGAC